MEKSIISVFRRTALFKSLLAIRQWKIAQTLCEYVGLDTLQNLYRQHPTLRLHSCLCKLSLERLSVSLAETIKSSSR